jgi:hypothetical protein
MLRVLGPGELVTRYIYSKRNIRTEEARPKPGAFNPSPHNVLSVVHSSGLLEPEIWAVGKQTLGSQPGRETIYARADIPVLSFVDVKLRAIRDDKPFERHTSVLDWPQGTDANERKQLWKHICLELSEDLRIRLAVPEGSVVRS